MIASEYVDCPACQGHGEILTTRDSFGNWDADTCGGCKGAEQVTPERAEEIQQDLDEMAEML